MESVINLLYWETLQASELNAMKIAKFMGREIRPVELTKDSRNDPQYLHDSLPVDACVIASAQTLSEICGPEHGVGESLGILRRVTANGFVYGFEPTQEHGGVLRELTAGSFIGVESLKPGNSTFRVGQDSRDICRQFAGLSFGNADPDLDGTFIKGITPRHGSSLIEIGEGPFFVRAREGGKQWLFVACREIADLDTVVPRDTSILTFFSGVAPLMMFIASASPDQCWHNDAPHACFILDDPLLKKRHGFLDYHRLLDLMDREQFCTSIAFIPWNFNRSDRELAEVFTAHPEKYSLCIHGSDHTRGEFGVPDRLVLHERAHQALDRMTQHRKLSGVEFDKVMVFPQGIFSTAAMEALRSSGYLAAVNSTPYPVDVSDRLTLSDLLQVAVTRFSNFPLFTRRYPPSVAELAFDLFVGKPALVVEHHGFFRDGYAPLAEIVNKLYSLDERLQWANLETTCSQACLKKVAEDGSIHVLFFTDRFCLRNETGQPQQYVLFRRALPEEAVKAVTVNGRPVDIGREADVVKTRLSLNHGEAVIIEVGHDGIEPITEPGRQNRMYKAKVFVRRSLSEFRDNYVDTNAFLGKAPRTR